MFIFSHYNPSAGHADVLLEQGYADKVRAAMRKYRQSPGIQVQATRFLAHAASTRGGGGIQRCVLSCFRVGCLLLFFVFCLFGVSDHLVRDKFFAPILFIEVSFVLPPPPPPASRCRQLQICMAPVQEAVTRFRLEVFCWLFFFLFFYYCCYYYYSIYSLFLPPTLGLIPTSRQPVGCSSSVSKSALLSPVNLPRCCPKVGNIHL